MRFWPVSQTPTPLESAPDVSKRTLKKVDEINRNCLEVAGTHFKLAPVEEASEVALDSHHAGPSDSGNTWSV